MRPRPLQSLTELFRGAIVRSVGSANSYVVDAVTGQHATAVRTVSITNPDEWILINPSDEEQS